MIWYYSSEVFSKKNFLAQQDSVRRLQNQKRFFFFLLLFFFFSLSASADRVRRRLLPHVDLKFAMLMTMTMMITKISFGLFHYFFFFCTSLFIRLRSFQDFAIGAVVFIRKKNFCFLFFLTFLPLKRV